MDLKQKGMLDFVYCSNYFNLGCLEIVFSFQTRILGFYLGNLVELNEEYKKGSTFPEELAKWTEEYGNIFKIQFLDKMMVAVHDPDAIKVLR